MRFPLVLFLIFLLAGCASTPQSSLPRQDTPTAQRKLDEWLPHVPANAQAPTAEPIVSALPPAPQLDSRFRQPISLTLRDAPLSDVITTLAKATGLNFVLDQEVNPEQRVTIVVKALPFEDVLGLILKTQQLEREIVGSNTLLIFPLHADKLKSYRALVTRQFSLTNADAKQVQNVFKQVLKARDLYVDERLNVLVLRDTPEIVRQAEFLVTRLDAADPEVMLEVEVLEVSRNRLKELGMKFPNQIGLGLLQGTVTTTTVSNGIAQTNTIPGGQLAEGYVNLERIGDLTTFAANPLLILSLHGENGESNLLANPRIRVKHREKARIHIGEKLPIFTTTSTANVGVAASVSYLDIGLKLDVEPFIHDAGEVGIKMGLEVSSVVREVQGPQQSLAYIVGTRSTNTSLRLHNGQTQILAGLISDEERRTASVVPGLAELPIIGRLFSANKDTNAKTEIVLLITPRVVRAPVRPSAAQQIWFGGGTELRSGSDAPPILESAPVSAMPTQAPLVPVTQQ